MNNSQDNRLLYLDALRGVAVLLVMLQHIVEHFAHWRVDSSDAFYFLHEWISAVDTGRFGVILFFAISGFVIPYSLSGARKLGTQRFLIKRFFRLFPAYWLSIPFGVITTWWFYEKTIGLDQVLLNFTMLPSLFGFQSVQGLYWTLELELIFYFLLVVLFLLRSHNNFYLLLCICSIMVYVRLNITEPQLAAWLSVSVNRAAIILEYTQYISVMFWGALVRFAVESGRGSFAVTSKYVSAGVLKMICLLAAFLVMVFLLQRPYNVMMMGFEQGSRELVRYGLPVFGAVCLFAVWVVCLKWHFKLLVMLGVISYSLYLFHPVALYTVDKMFCQPIIGQGDCSSGLNIGLFGYLLLSITLSILIASLVYFLVEKPSNKLGRRLCKRYLDPRPELV